MHHRRRTPLRALALLSVAVAVAAAAWTAAAPPATWTMAPAAVHQ